MRVRSISWANGTPCVVSHDSVQAARRWCLGRSGWLVQTRPCWPFRWRNYRRDGAK